MSAGENVATITVLMTIIFSMIVLGWALFYKCTDSTFKTDDLAVEKCFSFLAVPKNCLLYTSPSPRDYAASRMPSSA